MAIYEELNHVKRNKVTIESRKQEVIWMKYFHSKANEGEEYQNHLSTIFVGGIWRYEGESKNLCLSDV